MKIAVFGAAGLVGAEVVSYLDSVGRSVVPIVRDLGSAWSLIRSGREIRVADLRDQVSTQAALRDCTHVVNCALGDGADLVTIAENVTRSCSEMKIKRLVHFSSVTVYGDLLKQGILVESARGRPQPKSYAGYKLQQDDIVERAHNAGLSSVVLCIPHVIGPESRFVRHVADSIKRRSLVLIDGGIAPVGFVDVRNVALAVDSALSTDAADGKRVFITNGDNVSWGELVRAVSREFGLDSSVIRDLPSDSPLLRESPSRSMSALVRALVNSQELRAAIRGTWLGNLVKASAVRLRRGEQKEVARSPIQGDVTVPAASSMDTVLCELQSRRCQFSSARAVEILGFRSAVDFASSMRAFGKWRATVLGVGSPFDQLGELISQSAP